MSDTTDGDEAIARRRAERQARHLAREGLIRVGHMPIRDSLTLIKETLPTLTHAARFFEDSARALGEAARVDVESTFGGRALYVRDVELLEWIVAVPAVELFVGRSKLLTLLSVGAPARPPPRLDVAPRGELATIGELWITEGESHHVIRYDERGVFRESDTTSGDTFTFNQRQRDEPFTIDPLACPPTPTPIAMLCAPDLAARRGDIARLAALVSPDRVRAAVPVRVRLPTPIPDGAHSAWAIARGPLHRALVEERVPADATWLVCDGFDGTAVAWGRDLDEAMARWRDEVFRKKPRPPAAAEAVEPGGPAVERIDPATEHRDDETGTHRHGLGTFEFRVPPQPATIGWPPATPRNVPAVAVPLRALPSVPDDAARAGFTRWVRLLGKQGRVVLALRRDEPDGSTWIGEHALDLVDPATIADSIAAAEADKYADYPEDADPRRDPHVVYFFQAYRVWDDVRRERATPTTSYGVGGPTEPLSALGDDRIGWEVARIQQLPK